MRLYKDNSSKKLGLSIHFTNFTKGGYRENREIERRERKKKVLEEEGEE